MTNEYLVPINPKQPVENTIRFFNTMSGDNVEVLRISKDGITANPDVPVDEAAQAVLRAVDGCIKQLTQRKPLTDEQILHFVDTHVGVPSMAYPLDNSDWMNFARAIEAAHNIKD